MYIYDETEFTTEDMGRKFSGTWVNLKNFGVVKLQSFEENGFTFDTPAGSFVESPDKFIVEQDFPEVGIMVNHNNHCNLTGRIPRRQWVVGLTQNLLGLDIVKSGNKTILGRDRLNDASIKALFKPEYPPIGFCWNLCNSEVGLSAAFTKDYWLFNESKKAGIKILRKNIELGTITSPSKDEYHILINSWCSSFDQELKDELNNVKFTIKQNIQ